MHGPYPSLFETFFPVQIRLGYMMEYSVLGMLPRRVSVLAPLQLHPEQHWILHACAENIDANVERLHSWCFSAWTPPSYTLTEKLKPISFSAPKPQFLQTKSLFRWGAAPLWSSREAFTMTLAVDTCSTLFSTWIIFPLCYFLWNSFIKVGHFSCSSSSFFSLFLKNNFYLIDVPVKNSCSGIPSFTSSKLLFIVSPTACVSTTPRTFVGDCATTSSAKDCSGNCSFILTLSFAVLYLDTHFAISLVSRERHKALAWPCLPSSLQCPWV